MKNYKEEIVNYLIVVEGKKLEISLFENIFKQVLPKFVIISTVQDDKNFERVVLLDSDKKKKVYIIKPKHNTLSLIMKDVAKYKGDIISYKRIFGDLIPDRYFQKIFYVFDVDYTSAFDVKKALDFFCDENDQGLLILSSPCMEGICDFNSLSYTLPIADKVRISNTYKPLIRKEIRKISELAKLKNGLSLFIEQNIFTLMMHSLMKNKVVFNDLDFANCISTYSSNYLPTKTKNNYYFPCVLSFLHVIIGLIFEMNVKNDPTKELYGFLKYYSSAEIDQASIRKNSNYLK